MNNPSLGIQDLSQPILEIIVDAELVGMQVRQCTRQIATLLGFGLQDQTRLSLAVSQSICVLLQHSTKINTKLLTGLTSSSRLFFIQLTCSLDEPAGQFTGYEGWISDITSLKVLVDEVQLERTNSREISIWIGKKIPSEVSEITLTGLAEHSSGLGPCSPSDLIKAFQQEDLALLDAFTGLQKSQGTLRDLNLELENTNRGVVALYAELDERARSLHQAEASMAEASRQWEETFDAISDGIVLLDSSCKIIRCNHSFTSMVRRPYSEIIGQDCEVFPFWPPSVVTDCLDVSRQSFHRESVEIKVGERWINITCDPLKDEVNRFSGSVQILTDVTERKRAEEELLAAETALADANTRLEQRVHERTMELNVASEKLVRAFNEEQTMRVQLIQAEKNSALARMVASVAHEINNPIQTIKNCIYLLRQDTDPASGAAEILNMASSEATRIGDLVARLREIYRPSKDFTPRRFNVLDVLYNVHALLLPHLQHHNAHWELFSSAQSVFINGIPDQIKQVFLNICLNAIDAMENKVALLTVKITTPGPSQVCISFTDTGKGISSNDLPYIFEPFFTTKEKGSGLGLSICHEIVKNMNGNITVSSRPGRGTTFAVWLPTED